MAEGKGKDTTVWLLGSGFSKPLGGPLFSELLSNMTANWAYGWLSHKGLKRYGQVSDCMSLYEAGCERNLWSNPEECLALAAEAQTDAIASHALELALGIEPTEGVARFHRHLTQLVAIATSFFVDRVSSRSELPEQWLPYFAWAERLTKTDCVVTFNYDRVVEQVLARAENTCGGLYKLHGTVPESASLIELIKNDQVVEGLYTPGPHKLSGIQGDLKPVWDKAGKALATAMRLNIIGYSFPETDPYARSFILRKCRVAYATVVLGPGEDGERVHGMFKRNKKRGKNDRRLAQEYLAEVTTTSSK